MKVKQIKSRYILLVGILGLIVVGAFLAYQVYAAFIKTQMTDEEKAMIKPIDGDISTTVIDNLSKRRQFSSEELNRKMIASPTPSVSASKSAVIKQVTNIATTSSQQAKQNQ